MKKSYAVYIGSNTDTNNGKGLTILSVDTEHGALIKTGETELSNAVYLAASTDRRFLYSITDGGVASFRIGPDGMLTYLNTGAIRGMRGCHLSISRDDRYLFVSGYYDGKITVLHLLPDGYVGSIADGIFHQGIGSIAERNFRPHVRCARLTPDEKYLCVADSGIDQIKIYEFNHDNGRLTPCDVIHCKLQSAPRYMIFSSDGRYLYLIQELSNTISVYSYDGNGKTPVFEKVQDISTLGKQYNDYSAAVALQFSPDEKYLFCTNAGDHSLGFFSRDPESGMLKQLSVLPISGKYPIDVDVFPDGRHLFCTNLDSNTLTFFTINYEKGLIIMNEAPLAIPQPESSLLVELNPEA